MSDTQPGEDLRSPDSSDVDAATERARLYAERMRERRFAAARAKFCFVLSATALAIAWGIDQSVPTSGWDMTNRPILYFGKAAVLWVVGGFLCIGSIIAGFSFLRDWWGLRH